MADHGNGAAKRRRDPSVAACTGGTSSLRCRWPWQQPFITVVMSGPCRTTVYGARGQDTAETPDPPTPQPELFILFEEEPGGVRPGVGHGPCAAGEGFCGTFWSTGSRRAPSCRSSMLLCRRVGTSWWKRSGTLICTSPSRLSKCQRSLLHAVVVAGAGFPWCRRRNNWWKCQNSCRLPFCSSRSFDAEVFSLDRIIRWCGGRSWTLQFLMVVVGLIRELFKVHAQDRIQQRFVEQNTLKFQFLKGRGSRGGLLSLRPDSNSAASSAHSGAADEPFQGGFRTFSRGKKVRRWVRIRGRNCGLYFMDSGGLWRAHGARASAGGGV